MSPRLKREASPQQTEQVCKKLKDEIKSGDHDQTKEPKDKLVSNNNNNNNNNNDNNTDDKDIPATDTNGKNGASTDSTGTSEPSASADVQVNGDAKLEDSQKESTNGSKPDAQAKTEEAETAKKEVETVKKEAEKEEEKSVAVEQEGTLLICGGANWDMTGRKELPKNAKKTTGTVAAARNLWGPHRVCLDDSGKPLRVKGVFSGCNACHSVIVTDEGHTYTFGRNDKGQLGLGDTETRFVPTLVEALKDVDIVAAACGRSHTLFLTSDGIVLACGDNKSGQCGTNQMSVQQLTTPARIAFREDKEVVKMACGAEFSMIVDVDGRLYSFGHPEHGQLGHNSEGKYFTTGNKYAFHYEHAPRRIVSFIEKSREGHISPCDEVRITDIACGTNHTLAVDTKNRCFSWGFAGYHRLGHSETKNELIPRSIKVFDAPNNSGRGATKVFAGASHSMALDVNGLLYFWGQNKSSGEATMYPKTVQDLCGWKITAVACANRSIFVIADESCISWGPSPTYGELGYGEGKSKSSTVPQEVRTLDGVHVTKVACGYGHTLLIGRDSLPEDKTTLEKFRFWP